MKKRLLIVLTGIAGFTALIMFLPWIGSTVSPMVGFLEGANPKWAVGGMLVCVFVLFILIPVLVIMLLIQAIKGIIRWIKNG